MFDFGKMFMKYIFVFLLLGLNLIAQPKIMIEGGDVINWGSIMHSDESLKTKVKILNIGNDTLKISSVKPGCGCTTAPLDKTIIEPNGFANMDITLSLPGNAGKFAKNIDIMSNDTLEPKKVIWLRLEVIFPLSFFPQKGIKMGNMVVNAENKGKVILKNASKEKIYLKQIEFEPADMILNIKNDDFILPNGDIVIEATVKPSIPGAFSGKINFKTTEATMPRVELPISGVAN
jgi:hypothetical protein